MKLKEYMSLCEPGTEITCWDKDVDSEFYFYTKEAGEKSLYGKEFPNVDKCIERLAEVLDVVSIHDGGVEVNLYEKLEHPEIIRFAKENFYTENQYEDDSGVVMLLFDDNDKNISQGYEQFSGMMVKCLDLVYGSDKVVENNKTTIFGLAVVNSEGYYDATESQVHIYTSIEDCVNGAYEEYLDVWQDCEKNKIIEDDCECLTKEDFSVDFLSNGYVVIQMADSHVQFEYFRQELDLGKNKDLELSTGEIENDSKPKIKYGEMIKFINDNGILLMQPVIADTVDTLLPIGWKGSDEEYERLCEKCFDAYLAYGDERDHWDIVKEVLEEEFNKEESLDDVIRSCEEVSKGENRDKTEKGTIDKEER